MTDYKIAFFGVKPWERETVEKKIINLPGYGVGIFSEDVQDKLNIAAEYDILSVYISSPMDKELLAKLPKLKMIAARSTGIDHIDGSECKKRGIEVTNVPEYGTNTVAEYAMALLLAITKKIVVAHQSVEDGEFSPHGLTGVDIEGKTLGVIGAGKIGQRMAKYAKGMGMKVIAADIVRDEKVAKKLGFKYVTLEECLKTADFVSLHVPYVPETFHLINKKNIKLMKRGSYLVNTARGPVVETEALVWALNEGILAGVGLDVVEEENNLESMSMIMSSHPTKDDLQEVLSFHMLRDRDDVVFTPHNAFNTSEAIERRVEMNIESIKKFIQTVDK
ncbi:hydroxyacid dehydrogenase [Candidatus Shapirobacteria bacterium CG06_land_8_20_14_3_00_40_12]|uniref:Hydroxyacid dehydrogenase n=2 Tax=Candidatus Shapironibacteriota TaxID=1752721 RepID=A0A2M7TSP9_9BACT|nr:MAG: hydroxyacid dehydrogenase [Candidatus Shapirobacteria bacterium CG06_land_8_20_14_3_00_40_12]PIZ58829.1 MAG: hydroxyacid dehydrogenase [Candidatus Shapirobacteria bacterium CG_4_10_14_0_2_um_filter_40_12]